MRSPGSSGSPSAGWSWETWRRGRGAWCRRRSCGRRSPARRCDRVPSVRKIALITTGGTIEKTYDEHTGELANRQSIVRRMLAELRLEETEVNVFELMSKDSLEMTDADRVRILEAARATGACEEGTTTGIIVLHGTDTLHVTGEYLHEQLARPRVPAR